ncbi:hypothetical protein HU200_015479 [Digitaria exilis]|uniref:Tetratricopeptide repeat protein n=1 Tax=Digitaria exilis TaxID=1010633 RepID=A0A835FAU0_9POAL|nr:hypothetical protein HU200_015479 [Digitaria exilis]
MGKYKECVVDCDDAVERGTELGGDSKLFAKALSRRASALLELAGCAGDHAPAIRDLHQLLEEYGSEEKLEEVDEAERWRESLEDQKRLALEAADRHRERGNEYFKRKMYLEAAINYTRALKINPKDPRGRAQCCISLGHLPQGFKDAEKCVQLDPAFLEGYVCKAKVQFLMENYKNALETYLEGLRCDPNNLEVLDGLMRYLTVPQ